LGKALDYWKKFLSHSNFLLAWRRINTGSNVSYKRFFRDAYLAYEISLEANLDSLSRRINGGAYEPQPPDRIFIPKPSGFQRPISLLTIEDQIVWQAIANILELKWKARRAEVERKVVFSNHHSPNATFFFEPWKHSYRGFITRIKEIYGDNKWTAHFDLASYFDTISHAHISNLLTPKSRDSDIAVFIKQVLNCWSSEKISKRYSHGIPQGPIASAFVGEVILLDIDKPMMNAQDTFFYLRYVDDVRLFAKNEDRVRDGIIHLEQLCRNKGLVPQTKKTSTFFAGTENEAIGKDISLSSEDDDKPAPKTYLLSSIDMESKAITNTTKFKHFLYRGIDSPEHLDILLELFIKYPDLSDAFTHYFSKFRNNETIIDYQVRIIKEKRFPYQYVEGNVWPLLARIDINQRSSELKAIAEKRILLPTSRMNPYLRFGLLSYLAPHSKDIIRRVFNKFIYEDSAVVQGLLLPTIARSFSSEQCALILRQCFMRKKQEAGLVASYRLAIDNIPYERLAVSRRQMSPVRNCLVGLGIQKSTILPDITPFQELIQKRYQIQVLDWRPLLKKEYNHAHRVLALADRAFNINRSSWICLMDSFNEILTRALIGADKCINQKLVGSDGKLIDHGVLLNGSSFITKYGRMRDAFEKVHKRRCSIPEAHPYEQQTARRTAFLRMGEQHFYYGQLKQAYLDYNGAVHLL
jgi:retron-type reverse transcriptase